MGHADFEMRKNRSQDKLMFCSFTKKTLITVHCTSTCIRVYAGVMRGHEVSSLLSKCVP